MPKPLSFCNLLKFLWNGYSDDVGKSLIHLGAAGWFFSALAQIVMISTNDNINKKQKKFLIPQEISDGIINVGLYYTICQGIKNLGDSLVENGQILTNDTASFIKKIIGKNTNNLVSDVKRISDAIKDSGLVKSKKGCNITNLLTGVVNYVKGVDVVAIKNFDELLPTVAQNIKNNFVNAENNNYVESLNILLKNFNKFKNGIGVLTAVFASVLACSVITPVLRNASGNYFQKKLVKDKSIVPKNCLIYKQPISNIFSQFKI